MVLADMLGLSLLLCACSAVTMGVIAATVCSYRWLKRTWKKHDDEDDDDEDEDETFSSDSAIYLRSTPKGPLYFSTGPIGPTGMRGEPGPRGERGPPGPACPCVKTQKE
jgi:hypothetical protein